MQRVEGDHPAADVAALQEVVGGRQFASVVAEVQKREGCRARREYLGRRVRSIGVGDRWLEKAGCYAVAGYRRFERGPTSLAVLPPLQPPQDLTDLYHSLPVSAV